MVKKKQVKYNKVDDLLLEFLIAGYTEESFWSLTPKAFVIYLKAANERVKNEHNRAMKIAYVAHRASIASKPPKLEDLLVQDKKVKKQAAIEDAAAFASALFGFGATLPTIKTNEEPVAE